MLFLNNETGASMVEYGILLALVAIVVIAIVVVLGPVVANMYVRINECVPPTALCG